MYVQDDVILHDAALGGGGGAVGVGWCEGVVFLTSSGRPTDIGSQLGKACYPYSSKGRAGMFLFLLFLQCHSCSSLFPAPPFHLLYYLFYLFSPFLWETTQNDRQGLTCR